MRQNNFDLIRLFAAFQVMLFHGLTFLSDGPPSWIGVFPGVPIFFFVSGLLVSASFERSETLRDFATKRALRIFPALWLAFGLAILTVLMWRVPSVSDALAWGFAHTTVFQTWNPEFLRPYGVGAINGALWTIPVELCFYAAVPVLYWLFRRTGRESLVLTACIALSAVALYIANRMDTAAGRMILLTPVPYFWMFCCGVATQRNSRTLIPLVRGRFVLAFAAYIATVVAQTLYPLIALNGNVMGLVNFAALAFLVLAAAYSAPTLADRILSRNDISYGIYVFHMPIINAVLVHNGKGGTSLMMAIICTLALAAASWVFVESRAIHRVNSQPALSSG